MKECVSQLRIYLAIFKFNHRVIHFETTIATLTKCDVTHIAPFFYIKPINKEKRVRYSHNFGGLKQMREFFIDYIALFKEYIIKELNFNRINVLNRYFGMG